MIFVFLCQSSHIFIYGLAIVSMDIPPLTSEDVNCALRHLGEKVANI